MATRDLINLGTAPDTGTGDSARRGGEKINTIFVDTYTTLGDNPIVTNVNSASYGQRQQFASDEFKVGELHPAGRWNTLKPSSNALSSFDAHRGDQIIVDLDGHATDTFTINLPLANPGDVIKFRDGLSTWASDKKVQFLTTPLNPIATSSTTTSTSPVIYTAGAGFGEADANNDLVFTVRDLVSQDPLLATDTLSVIVTSPAAELENDITYNAATNGSINSSSDTLDFDLSTTTVGDSLVLEVRDINAGGANNETFGPIILADNQITRLPNDVVRISVQDLINADPKGFFLNSNTNVQQVLEDNVDRFIFTITINSAFTSKTITSTSAISATETFTGTNFIERVNDTQVKVTDEALEQFTDINDPVTAELKSGDSFLFTITTIDTSWNLSGSATIDHANINGIPFSNDTVVGTADNGFGVGNNITATTLGFTVDLPDSEVELFYIGHDRGWRATVDSVKSPISTGTVIYDKPFYNTSNYSNDATAEQAVVFIENGSTLDQSVTQFVTPTTDERRKSCNTIIVDENWILNGSSNGIILNDNMVLNGETADQWTIYMALPQSTSNWDDIIGKNFEIVNNSSLPVIVKPLVFDFTNSTTVAAIEADLATYVKASLGTNTATEYFAGLDNNKTNTLANYALIDANTSTSGSSTRLSVQYPGLTTTDLVDTPLDLENRFDTSIRSVTFAFTADGEVNTASREYAWRVINSETTTVTPRQREFIIVTGEAAATAHANTRGGYSTPNQTLPTYLYKEEALVSDAPSVVPGPPQYNFVKAGSSANEVTRIVTGLANLDPFATDANATISYSALEVYVNGTLQQEGTDWRAFVSSAQTGVTDTSNYKGIIDAGTITYAFALGQVTRVEEVNGIEFQSPLADDAQVEIHWIPAVSLPTSLEASITNIVQNNVSSITNQVNEANEHNITNITEANNVLANMGTTSVDSTVEWQNNEVTNNSNLNPTGGWYLEIPFSVHSIGNSSTTPRVIMHEAVDTTPADLPGFTAPGFLEATVRVSTDNTNTIFISSDRPFTGKVSIYR